MRAGLFFPPLLWDILQGSHNHHRKTGFHRDVTGKTPWKLLRKSHSVQSREHRLWKHEPIWPLEWSTVNSWALKHGARLCMPYWCYKTGSRLAVAWSISNSFTVPSVACSQMTFGWQKLGLQSWQSGMQPTVFWQTHNWPSDHQPTFYTQVTGGSGLLIGPYFSSCSSSQTFLESNIETT